MCRREEAKEICGAIADGISLFESSISSELGETLITTGKFPNTISARFLAAR